MKKILLLSIFALGFSLNNYANECATATPIIMTCGGATTVTGSTVGDTPLAEAFCGTGVGSGGASWYQFTGDGGSVTISTVNAGTDYDTKLWVYEGTCGTLNCIGGNDDFSGVQSQVVFTANAGYNYYIVVGGFSTSQGNYELSITSAATNCGAECVSAIPLVMPSTCVPTLTLFGSTTGGTPNGLASCITSSGSGGANWYNLSGDGNTYTASTVNPGTGYDTKIWVFEGTCGSLNCVTGNDDFSGVQSTVTFTATTGLNYYVIVGGFSANEGNYELLISTDNNTTSAFSVTSCSGPYTVPSGDESYSANGVYMDTIPNASGCDSVMTITLTMGSATTSAFSVSSCIGTYTVPSGDESYSANGVYMDTIPNASGCDSIMTITATIGNVSTSAFSVASCSASYTVPSGDEAYTSSGVYMDTIPNASGCDSVMTITLTIGSATASAFTTSTCTGAYTVPSGDETYTSSGVYMDTIPNVVGCDSVMTITVTVGDVNTSAFSVSVCTVSYTVPSGDETYTSSGVYMDTIPNASGCDSVMTITLTMGTANTSAFTASTCSGTYTVPSGDETYTSSGVYMDTIPNASGCDSVMTITVTVGSATGSSEMVTSCGDYTWSQNSMVYTMSGVYMDTVTNAVGCDSILTLNLTVVNLVAGATQSGVVLTASGGTNPTYQWINCSDNTPLTGEVSQTYTATADGLYAVVISEGACSDTSNCVDVTNTSVIDNFENRNITLYPNPNTGEFFISFSESITNGTIEIVDAVGKVVLVKTINGNRTKIDISNEVKGIYFVKFTSTEYTVIKSIVKQ